MQTERLLNTFLTYAQIGSESTHEGAVAARIAEDLRVAGCQVSVDESGARTGSETGNLYCTLPGNAPGEPILLAAHMDTVVPGAGVKPVLQDGIIRSGGDTVLGGDDKSGVAAIVEVLRTVVEEGLPHPTIEAVFTVCEEIGLLGSQNLDYGRITAKKAAVLDGDGDAGRIIIGAPGQDKLEATITGRRAHAGVAPEEGISAIQVAAEAISRMKLLRIDGETTANVGAISAQYATNIVPEVLTLAAEARSRDSGKLDRQSGHMVDCLRSACEKYGAKLDVSLTRAYDAFSYGEDDPFVREVVAACHRAGLEPQLDVTGGGSDANNMNAHGIKALVLSTGMAKVHTVEEELEVRNLENTARLVLALVTGQGA